MNVTEEQVRQALAAFVSRVAASVKTFAGTVESVNEGEKTCVVVPTDGGASFHDVKLKPSLDGNNDGVIAIPALGSSVLVGRISNPNDTFIMMPGKVAKYIIKCSDGGVIELNGSGFSMVKAETLKTELDKTNDLLTALIAVINGVVVNEASGPSVLQATFKAAIVGKALGSYNAIKNDKVKHG